MPNKSYHRQHGRDLAKKEYRRVCRESGKKPNKVGEKIAVSLGGFYANNPDRIDPPSRGPHHRGYGHSEKSMESIRMERNHAREKGQPIRAAINEANLSHYRDDAKTPHGLPEGWGYRFLRKKSK